MTQKSLPYPTPTLNPTLLHPCARPQAALYFANFQQRRAPADSGALAAGGAHPAADADVVRALVAEVATILAGAKFSEALAVRAP